MKHRKSMSALLLLLGLLCASAHAQPIVKNIAPGITLIQEVQTNPGCPLVINCVSIDLSDPRVQIKAALGKGAVLANDPTKGRETISSLTARTGALVGVNADFFPFTGDPLGICIIDGELISEPAGNRAAVAITNDRAVFFDTPKMNAVLTTASGAMRTVAGINRPRSSGEIVVYTSAFGPVTVNPNGGVNLVCALETPPVRVNTPLRLAVREIKRGAVSAPDSKDTLIVSAGGEAAAFIENNIAVGDTITVQFDIKSPNDCDWTNVLQAVGGGPWLLRGGKRWIDTIAEGFSVTGFEQARHPRTAVGITSDNKLLLVTVDGRQSISAGISLPDLADLMKRLGAVTAINLDGGGSTALSVRGIVINSPSGGIEREVANALLVFAPIEDPGPVPQLSISGLPSEAVSGYGLLLGLSSSDASPPSEELLNKVIWGTIGGIGFVNQKGYFTPIKSRKGAVAAIVGRQILEAPVTVIPGAPERLAVGLEDAETDRSIVRVTAYDINDNPVPSCRVSLTVTGGKPDAQTGFTNERSVFETLITWGSTATQDRLVVATAGSLRAEARPKPRTSNR
ncbi:MAG: phosphodiester glycosidase family protein [Armatimonadota bacterium]|nr:phosphodiester glycosidase family protein [Armatimonadota bacterium]